MVKEPTPDRIPRRYDAVLTTKPIRPLKDGEVLVKMTAAGFNHRDVSIYIY